MENKETTQAVAVRGSVKISDAKGKRGAVFGRWDGDALITDAGRLASSKAFGLVKGVKGAAKIAAYSEAQKRFNTLGEAFIASQQSEVASGRRDVKRVYTNPKNGRVHIETAPADKANKVLSALEGLPQDRIDKVLAALKLA